MASPLTVNDTSPVISYIPLIAISAIPDPFLGWNPHYSISGFATAPGVVGLGTSSHITSLNGASLSLQWNGMSVTYLPTPPYVKFSFLIGTGIQLFGNASNASYELLLDNVATQPDSSDPTQSLLASFQNLSFTMHTISLMVDIPITASNAFVAFEHALVQYPPPAPK